MTFPSGPIVFVRQTFFKARKMETERFSSIASSQVGQENSEVSALKGIDLEFGTLLNKEILI
jgi:hypothetical protein